MAGTDVQLIEHKDGLVEFTIKGKSTDIGLMLLQRLYVLLFTDQDNEYRSDDLTGYSLLGFLDGANRPSDQILNSLLAISCATALRMLDEEDRALIDTFSGWSTDSVVTFTLTLVDGTTIQGDI